jgi:hypothetical protein
MRFAAVFCLVFALAVSARAAAILTPINHPSADPPDKAQFGFAVAILDYNGDGTKDIAASAPGENKVYILLGGDFSQHLVIEPPEGESALNFGCALAAGPLDSVEGDELAIGANNSSAGESDKAGKLYVAGRAIPQPIVLQGNAPLADERLGTSVALGDYDNDGALEIAGGASGWPGEGYPGGKVYIFDLDLSGESPAVSQRVFNNHQNAPNGNYGHDISTADWNGDGIDDLFISAIGNDRADGAEKQGQMVIILGPFAADGSGPGGTVIIEDNMNVPGEDGGRFGMSIDARERLFAVGSPRKDCYGTSDAGMGFIFRKSQEPRNFSPEDRIQNGILGYRTRIGDFIGDDGLDAAFFSLPRGIYIYASADESAEPMFVPRPNNACAHWCVGAAAGQLYPGGKEELVLGGNDWEPAGSSKTNIGRIHIVTFEEPKTGANTARKHR